MFTLSLHAYAESPLFVRIPCVSVALFFLLDAAANFDTRTFSIHLDSRCFCGNCGFNSLAHSAILNGGGRHKYAIHVSMGLLLFVFFGIDLNAITMHPYKSVDLIEVQSIKNTSIFDINPSIKMFEKKEKQTKYPKIIIKCESVWPIEFEWPSSYTQLYCVC